MIVTSMQLTISSRRDIAVLQKESSSFEGEEDVKAPMINDQASMRPWRIAISVNSDWLTTPSFCLMLYR